MQAELILSESGPPQGALFDYATLDAETRIVVQQRTGEIRTLAKRVAQDIVDIGEKLTEVKDHLGGNGRFVAWLESELGWAERTAYNYIGVYTKFGRADFEIGNIATSALYLLSAPSTPPAAIETAKQIAKDGGKVTHTLARTVVKEAKAAEERAKGDLFEETEASADEDGAVCLCECKASDHGENGRCKKCACEVYEDASAAQIEDMEADAVAIANVAGKQGAAIPVSQATMDKLKKGTAPVPKLDDAAKEIEQAWRKAEICISFRYMPADKAGRKVLVAIQAEGVDPDGRFNKLKHESDVQFIGPVLELLEDYKRALPAKIAAKKSTKPPAKPAAKAAKKGAKK